MLAKDRFSATVQTDPGPHPASSTTGTGSFPEVNGDGRGINPLRTKLYLSNLKTQFVPRSKHSASVIKTDKLTLYREIIAVCSQIHTKHINTLCGQNRISEC